MKKIIENATNVAKKKTKLKFLTLTKRL